MEQYQMMSIIEEEKKHRVLKELEQIRTEVEDISIKRGYHEYYFKSPKEMKEEMLKILDKHIKELE